jgi:phage terminase large subunit-like protein
MAARSKKAPAKKKRRKTATAPSPRFHFDEDRASRIVDFIQTFCRHVEGERAGDLFQLEPWQSSHLREAFGWLRADGSRRYRTIYLEVPRKNGKTTLISGVGLYMLTADGEQGAQVYSAAADRAQAGLTFGAALRMTNADPELRTRIKHYASAKRLVVGSTGSTWQVLSADAYTKHGLSPSAILFDELHAQPNRELWDVLTTGTGARLQPLTYAITTAGHDRTSICWELHEYAVKVRAGLIQDDSFLPLIFAADEGDDWKDPATWAKANPNLGISIRQEFLEQEAIKAAASPGRENAFRRLYLNQWTEQETRWLSVDRWDRCASQSELHPNDLIGMPCFVGLDLSSTTDLTSFGLWFPEQAAILSYSFIPKSRAAQAEERDRVPYTAWERDGFLEFAGGEAIDLEHVYARLVDVISQYDVREVGFDRWNAAHIASMLERDGIPHTPVRQGYGLSSPMKEVERRVIRAELTHFANPVLRWAVANVAVRTDAGENVMPVKGRSRGRIDPLVAVLIAIERSLAAPMQTGSIYDSRGVVQLGGEDEEWDSWDG